MNKSESTKNLAAKLIKFQQENVTVVKDSTNPFHKNKYASLSAYLSTVIPALNKIGVSVAQFPMGSVLVTHVEDVDSGEWMQGEYPIIVAGQKPQEIASQVTYARRYSLSGIFMQDAEDDDGNASSGLSLPPIKNNDKNSWLNKGTKEFNDAVTALKAGKVTIEDVNKRYNLSKEVMGLLIEQSK